jgi:hypothetical protein
MAPSPNFSVSCVHYRDAHFDLLCVVFHGVCAEIYEKTLVEIIIPTSKILCYWVITLQWGDTLMSPRIKHICGPKHVDCCVINVGRARGVSSARAQEIKNFEVKLEFSGPDDDVVPSRRGLIYR